MAEDPIAGPWIRGRLALAQVNLSVPVHVWLDAVYALLLEMPGDELNKLATWMIRQSALIDPEAARATWGRTPAQQQLAGNLARGPGVEAGDRFGGPPAPARPARRNLRDPGPRITRPGRPDAP